MSTAGPRCPNHAIPLTDCHKGVGICPVSGCQFTYKADEHVADQTIKVDKFGNKEPASQFVVQQMDGTGG